MTYYHVYQARLSDERTREANMRSAVSPSGWDRAYYEISCFVDQDNGGERLAQAVEHDLFVHTADIEARDPEEAFQIGNIQRDDGGSFADYIRFETVKPSSMSVGNVLISADHKEGWLCCSTGWLALDYDTIRWFETKVATTLRLAT